jgi:hypothetical protein
MIITDENGEFSSVKDHNDFNDSSWLARLVNGLEEAENMGGRPLSEISNLISVASSQINKKLGSLENNIPGEQTKEDEQPKGMVRKSVPIIPSYRCPKGLKENHKPNCQSQPITEPEPRGGVKDPHFKSSSEEGPKPKGK